MNIKSLLGTTLIVSGLFFTQSIQPAMAAAGDDPASVIATRLAPGEVAVIRDGPAGFQVVDFFLGGVLVSTVESGTTNTGSTSSSAGIAQTYAETSAHLGSPFLGNSFDELLRTASGDGENAGSGIASAVLSSDGGLSLKNRRADHLQNQGFATNIQFTPSSKNPGVNLRIGNKNSERPWVLAFGASYSGLNDRRANADRDADIYTLTVAGLKQISENTFLGAELSFKDGEVTSDALISTLDGTYYGLTLIGKHHFGSGIIFSGFVNYTHGDNDVNLNGATGQFDTSAFSTRLKAQMRLAVAGINIDPDASISFRRVRNDAFLASNGVATIATRQSYTEMSIGGTFSRLDAGGSSNFKPSVGIHGVYSSRAGSDLALINGATVDDLGLGVSITPALEMTFENGGQLSFNSSITSYKDVTSWSVGAGFSMAF